MPLVTLTLRLPYTATDKAAILDGIHAALVASGVPAVARLSKGAPGCRPAGDGGFDPALGVVPRTSMNRFPGAGRAGGPGVYERARRTPAAPATASSNARTSQPAAGNTGTAVAGAAATKP